MIDASRRLLKQTRAGTHMNVSSFGACYRAYVFLGSFISACAFAAQKSRLYGPKSFLVCLKEVQRPRGLERTGAPRCESGCPMLTRCCLRLCMRVSFTHMCLPFSPICSKCLPFIMSANIMSTSFHSTHSPDIIKTHTQILPFNAVCVCVYTDLLWVFPPFLFALGFACTLLLIFHLYIVLKCGNK